jgi:hypothetical protein
MTQAKGGRSAAKEKPETVELVGAEDMAPGQPEAPADAPSAQDDAAASGGEPGQPEAPADAPSAQDDADAPVDAPGQPEAPADAPSAQDEADAPEADETNADAEAEASDAKVESAEKFEKAAKRQRKRAASADARADYVRALDGRVPSFGQLPDDKPLSLRFADSDGFIDGAIEVGREDLTVSPSGRATYAKPVEFAPLQEGADLTEVWLLGGKSGVRIRIHGGLRIGDGRSAAIPAGHLRF